MKKQRLAAFALILIVACMLFALTGCRIKGGIIGLSDYRYDDEGKYTVGEAELTQTIESLEIDWLVGNLTVLPHNLNSVCFSEESQRELTDDTKLRYWLDGTTLRIRFCACGKRDLSELKKDLTILVPDTLIMSSLKVNSISANANLKGVAVTQSVKVNTVSGEFEADFTQPLNEFNGDSTSGSFTIIAPKISRFDIGTVSGEVSLSSEKECDLLEVDATSGSVSLSLPENASFTLDYDTVSGDLSSELSHRRSFGKYIFGDGNGEYEISTVSGDIEITAK